MAPAFLKRWPNAHVTFVDSATSMLEVAQQEHKENDSLRSQQFSYVQGDFETYDPGHPVDLIFSNAALQWARADQHKDIMSRLYSFLKPGGVLAFQIPDTRLQPNYHLMVQAAAELGLSERAAGVRSVTCEHDPEFYYDLFKSADKDVELDVWVTVYAHILEGDNPVADFTSSTGLRPFMKALGEPSTEATQFEQKYRELIAAAYPKQRDGSTIFHLKRFFLTAAKPFTMSSSMDPRALINYYIRKGCYSSAIRELENLKRTGRDVELPCLHALVYAHSQCKHVDHDEVAQLELQLVMAEENASSASLMLCATFFWHLGEHAKARKILDQLLSSSGKSSSDGALRQRALILRGWVDLTVDPKVKRDADLRDNAVQFFDQVTERRDAELVLGMAKYYDMKKAYPRALESFDEITVQFPWFKHSLSEKALVLLKMGNWDQCMDSVERALSENAREIEAMRITILLLLSREGHAREAAERVRDLLEALKRVEPANPELFCEISRCTARVSDRDSEVLQCSLGLIEHAIQLNPDSGAFRAERGYQRGLLGDYAEAMESYKEALKLDESNEMALHGMIYCQIKLGQLEDASQQMEFLSVIQESIGASASFAFLQALLSWEKDRDRPRQVKLLQQAMQIHMDKLKETIQGPDVSTHDTMSLLNPIFLVEVATEFLQGDTPQPGSPNDSLSDAVLKGMSILEKLVNKSPGFLRAQYVLAQAYFDSQKLDDAYQVTNLILKMDPGHSKAHLMQARVSLEREHFRAASSCLDQALSYDFSVRQSLSYYIIKARILENAGDVREALQTLQTAMKMIQSAGGSMITGTSNRRQKQSAENNAGGVSLSTRPPCISTWLRYYRS
ncbi:Tetratricopeptide repeat protein 21B [Phytophthora cinnamomi]|uniref:Tetratricopeptide repeat protein 21B n=2 Tax=Phytophthora cinnamomi TaxID=4785 RepID=UPI00355A71DF|nr:Tetratricopeptide repeat protein 21B [Phytophthora cinnamomi]